MEDPFVEASIEAENGVFGVSFEDYEVKLKELEISTLSRNHSNHAESDDYGDNFVGVGAKYDDYCDHGDQRPDFEYGADGSFM